MAMELFTSHDQFICDFSAHYEKDNFRSLYIVQHSKISDAKVELCKCVRTQSLYGTSHRRRLVFEA